MRKGLQVLLLCALPVACNQFPPISGRDQDEANEIIYYLQDSLKASKSETGVLILARGGNQFVSVYVYGVRDTQAQQKLVAATRTYVQDLPFRKDVHLRFLDQKHPDGRDGTLLYACVVPSTLAPDSR